MFLEVLFLVVTSISRFLIAYSEDALSSFVDKSDKIFKSLAPSAKTLLTSPAIVYIHLPGGSANETPRASRQRGPWEQTCLSTQNT
jgi:hypothetical protein